MSMASDLFVAIGRGHQNALTMWANKFKVPLPSGGAWKDRVKLATDFVNKKKEATVAKVKESTKPKKKIEEDEEEEEQPTTKKKKPEPEKTNTLGSKEVADMLGVTPATLRRYLRAKGHNTEGEYARYEWEKDSPRLAKLLKEFKANQESAEESRKENLKKGKDEKGGKKGAKKKNEDVDEEEEEEEEEEETEEL